MSHTKHAPTESHLRPASRGARLRYVRVRLPIAIGIMALAALVRLAGPRPPAPTVEGVAAMLATAVHGVVVPAEFVWEGGRGAVSDALWGRHVLFLAAEVAEGPRDLYRARVRVSPGGRPIAVTAVRNLTETPLGDERRLLARGRYAAVLTSAYGRLQGATVIDLAGEPGFGGSRAQRLASQVRAWAETDSWQGLGRTELVFGVPPLDAEIALDDNVLAVAVRDPVAAPVVLRLSDGLLERGAEGGVRAETWRAPPHAEPWPHSAMNAARRLLGTDMADGVKSLLFRGRSGVLRLLARWRRSDRSEATASSVSGTEPESTGAGWPPEPIPPLFAHPLDGEGQWRAPTDPWLLPPLGEETQQPYLLETIIRPDPALPFSAVRLVAMDTRQLDLRIEAGFDEPRPQTGPRGRGRIPSPALTPDALRVVGAFNGAFQTEHGAYGMVVDHRILLPPRSGAATVVVDTEGRTWMGNWGPSEEVPPWAASLRQNLDPLLDGGVLNPRGRRSWGFPLEGGTILTERSALCLTARGHLVYGWGMEIAPDTLGHALLRAGCVYAMHLDMNPGHVGFTYLRVREDGTDARLLTPEMSIAPRRFVEASPKDFFYLVRRTSSPQLQAEVAWRADTGVQPPPSWLTAVHRASLERLGAPIELWAFDAGRFQWEIRPGARESAGWTAIGPLEPADHARALVALGLGVAFRKDNRRGLVLDSVSALPVRPDLGLLTIDPERGSIELGIAPDPVAPVGDATELPLLAIRGELQSEARELGTMKLRSAACMTSNGLLLVALCRFDSGEANARALLDLGCERVVELDRGSQVDAFVHRAGAEPAPAADYDDTVLYGLSTTMRGRARRLEPLLTRESEPAPPEPGGAVGEGGAATHDANDTSAAGGATGSPPAASTADDAPER